MQEQNTEKFIECINVSHKVCGPNNLVAIKVTSLIRPATLKKFNQVLKSVDNFSQLPSIFLLINEKSNRTKAITSADSSLIETAVLQYEYESGKIRNKLFICTV